MARSGIHRHHDPWPKMVNFGQIYVNIGKYIGKKINFSQIMPYKGESVKTLGGPPLKIFIIS